MQKATIFLTVVVFILSIAEVLTKACKPKTAHVKAYSCFWYTSCYTEASLGVGIWCFVIVSYISSVAVKPI